MPTFQQIWSQHPNVKGEDALLDRGQYPNQCAVNLYAALQRSGVDIRTFHGQLSWQKDKPKYAIRAQELANWLAAPGSLPGANVKKLKGVRFLKKLGGRRESSSSRIIGDQVIKAITSIFGMDHA